MAGSGAKGRWGRVLRYAFAGFFCLVTVAETRAGLPWYWSLIGVCTVFFIILGRRRIFRAGVTRTSDEIVCRYLPWYEGNAYFLNVLLPLMGVASLGAGFAPGNPAWFRFGGFIGGFILLGLTPLFTSSAVRMWRLNFLRITPSALTVRLVARLVAPKDKPTEIRRERVESITSKIVTNGAGGESLQVEIAYHTTDLSTDATKTVLLGLQLSVPPINLLHALVAWKDATHYDPSELLDRIEGILRGRSTAGVTGSRGST
jgi:hypothetical protein